MRLLWQSWAANGLADWSLAALLAGVALLLFLLGRVVGERLLRELASRKRIARYGQVPQALFSATRLWLLLPAALDLGATALDLPERLDRGLDNLVVIALLVQAAFWLNALANLWLTGEIEKRRVSDGAAVTALSLLHFALRMLVWTMVLLVILNHLNFNVSALVTGLGVGGVAVALAVQNILGDLFASLSIVLDKPFVVGDFIIVDDCMGAVEHVGIKTTRVRSLGGELIVFSNADLLKSRIRNYKRMYERRVVFTLGVTYATGADALAAIPALLREAVLANQQVRFDRAHFKEYGESALVFEVVYFVLSPDFNLYMDIQQDINLTVFRRFAERGVEFAHPIRILQVQGDSPPLPQGPAARGGGKRMEDQPWTANAIA